MIVKSLSFVLGVGATILAVTVGIQVHWTLLLLGIGLGVELMFFGMTGDWLWQLTKRSRTD